MKISYEKVYEIYNKKPWYMKTEDVFKLAFSFFSILYQDRFNEELRNEFKKLYPKRKKIDLNLLPDDIVNPLREKYENYCVSAYLKTKKQINILASILNGIAESIEIIPSDTMMVVDSANSSTYSSQGWGASKYAKGSLMGKYSLLEGKGYKVEIRENKETSSKYVTYYDLYCNLEKWQVDCVLRRDKQTVGDWAMSCWEKGLNPKVLNPFLDDEVYYETLNCYSEKFARLN